MKYLIAFFSCVAVFCIATGALAESLFVTETFEVTMRTGPGTQHKIVAMLPSGQKVDLVDKGKDWSLIRLANGKEGYALNRFLTADTPKSILLERLQKQYTLLRDRSSSLDAESKALKEENKRLTTDLATTAAELEKLNNTYETLKKESAEFFKLKSNFEKVSTQLAEQSEKGKSLEAALSKAQLNKYIWWFVAGASVLLVGFLLGFSSRRQRHRSSLY